MLKKLTALLSILIASSWVNAQGDLRLIQAVKDQDIATARVLLDSGIDVNEIEADGSKALHWSIHRDNAEISRLLIEAGIDVNAKNRYEVAALSLAANNGNSELVSMLLDAGAFPNTAMAENETAWKFHQGLCSCLPPA